MENENHQFLDLVILKSVFCASLEGAQFYPAKVVYYVRRFQFGFNMG